MTKSSRIPWIDCAKGFGMLLVLIGHSVSDGSVGDVLRAVIFSFHMPLFFILSSMTFHYSSSREEFILKTKKAFRHLIVPVFILFGITTVWDLIGTPLQALSTAYWRLQLYRLILGSGVVWQFGDLSVPALGLPWFLYVLFFSRTLYDYLHLNLSGQQLPVFIWVISILGVLLGTEQDFLPFSLDIAFAALPFFSFGCYLKTKSREIPSMPLILICSIIWLFLLRLTVPNTSLRTYLELSGRRYPLFPLCYFAAGAGTLAFCEAAKILCSFRYVSKPFIEIGKNSLYLLIIHHLDFIWASWWAFSGRPLHASCMRILIDVCCLAGFLLLKRAFSVLRTRYLKNQ